MLVKKAFKSNTSRRIFQPQKGHMLLIPGNHPCKFYKNYVSKTKIQI